MKFFCRALCVLLITVAVVRAQDDDEADYGDYKPTLDDDLIQYVPKYTVRLGFRGISGVKSQFGGTGTLTPPTFPTSDSSVLPINVGDPTGVQDRVYHDGYVLKDSRTTTDPAGNTAPVPEDGFTNTWGFTNSEQVTEDGLMTMHTYQATLSDSSLQEKKTSLGNGVELALERDYGNLLGTRMQWGVIGGMSINQFNAIKRNTVNIDLTTVTDYYSLGGQGAPDEGYFGPKTSNGVDTTVLLGNEILRRITTITQDAESLTTRWQSRGAYVTLRAGPTLFVPIGKGFSASLSAGAVIVYAGSTYSVTQNFKPETGDEVENYTSDGKSAILPGFYVDANLQWTMTETAGLYVGAVYQSSGDYTQTLESDDKEVTYTNRIDLSSLQGLRAGVNFRF